jgi:hypothetical protein
MTTGACGPAMDLEGRFTRAVEAEYAERAARYRAAGADRESAHQQALEEAKDLGRRALEDLRAQSLFPWRSGASARRGGGNA